jgi:hypothetical protein
VHKDYAEGLPKLVVSKLEAARRQLNTAIHLWFFNGDVISIHTLAYAAYEVIHVVSKKRKRPRTLLFDDRANEGEESKAWALFLKKSANFFKHAKEDTEATIEFTPALNELFLLYSLIGLQTAGELLNGEEKAFMYWLCFNKPALLTELGRQRFIDSIPIEELENIRSLPKPLFLQKIIEGHYTVDESL